MIVTPEIIKANQDKLFIVEVAYYARPQHCRRDREIGYFYPNTYPLYTKWYCCEDERAFFKDYEFEQLIKPLWERQLEEIVSDLKDGEYKELMVCETLGDQWSRLVKQCPQATTWLMVKLLALNAAHIGANDAP